MNTDEQRIREFAFQIWESEGRPHGQHERHWMMARKLAEAESQAQLSAVPKPRRISKPKTVPLSEAEQPALLKKPRAPRTPKTPKA
ncbi:DUF2934 domain-containing protein [Pseudomonas berkeleyensis]|uniref:DUF2934 domain-containing protein n=1 Tax=Pseudomonas berkeleyensis TaxID=2726956 RepID=A0A7G5DGY0_9PSED|nr:DUF2934 domain-containing protein [Pseudomonas berkeleyensis]QMV61005.1 DUF2934 domain-containing protein [Pseudomonas berkeleyensis]WSO36431.1 DUF2934 domain-containing protein [Pseudomonas berkeleyensis]